MNWSLSKTKKEIRFYKDENEISNTYFYVSFKNDDEVIECLNKLNIDIEKKSKIICFTNHKTRENPYWESMPDLCNEKSVYLEQKIKIVYDEKNTDVINFVSQLLDLKNPLLNKTIKYGNFIGREKGLIIKSSNTYDVKYPIYVISKGRYKNITTTKYLRKINVKYYLVVEENEKDLYIEHGEPEENILILDNEFKQKQIEIGNGGGIPARNFVYNHSKNILNTKRHWILDDNISGYYILYKDKRHHLQSSITFRLLEDFVDRFTNVYLSGHNYSFFVIKKGIAPYYLNTKVYSSLLIDNRLGDLLNCEYLWRGVYNEDVDLCLRTLKKGLPIICLNFISSKKKETMAMKGGNTSTIYSVNDAHKLKTESLVNQHSDCVKMIKRFNRFHHLVDYSIFKNEPIYDKDYIKTNEINNYGLIY